MVVFVGDLWYNAGMDDENLIREIATAKQFRAWGYAKIGWKQEEIAKELGISQRAISKLHQCLMRKIRKLAPGNRKRL